MCCIIVVGTHTIIDLAIAERTSAIGSSEVHGLAERMIVTRILATSHGETDAEICEVVTCDAAGDYWGP
jgi:hypothetical protein